MMDYLEAFESVRFSELNKSSPFKKGFEYGLVEFVLK